MMLKQVVLPAPLGPDQRHNLSCAAAVERNVVQRLKAAERLGDVLDAQQRSALMIHCRRTRSNRRCRCAADAHGKGEHQQQNESRRTRSASTRCGAGVRSCSQVNAAAPIERPGERIDCRRAARSARRRSSAEWPGYPARCCPWKTRTSRRPTREGARQRTNASHCVRRTSMPTGLRPQRRDRVRRAARSRTASARSRPVTRGPRRRTRA